MLSYPKHIIALVLFLMLLFTFRNDPLKLVITVLAYPFLYMRFIGYNIYSAIAKLDDNLQWRDMPGLLTGFLTRRIKNATARFSDLRGFAYRPFTFIDAEFGTGMSQKTLATLYKRLKPLAIRKMPLAAPPPRDNRFGRPLELAKVHWLRPELVAEITYLSWPDDGLLRHTVFVALREDKPAGEVRRETPRTT